MLMIERRVVAHLTTSADPVRRGAVMAWVEGSLGDMPDVLRAGVLLESMACSALLALRPAADVAWLLHWLDRSAISLLRSYPRLFRSLVLFGELELEERAAS